MSYTGPATMSNWRVDQDIRLEGSIINRRGDQQFNFQTEISGVPGRHGR